uniref:JmjC domain-containing protein 5 n=1 Tax=Arcella intermedia TaxID=1963864 RepID=A0A6B2L7B5_9EUKA
MTSFKTTSMEEDLVQILYDLAWGQLHVGYWKDTPTAWRDVFSLSCLYLGYLSEAKGDIQHALEKLDLGILMGGPTFRNNLHCYVKYLHHPHNRPNLPAPSPKTEIQQQTRQPSRKRKRSDINFEPLLNPSLEIPRVKVPSLTCFLRNYMSCKKPVIITGLMANWPALGGARSWNNFSYLKSIAGMRTVPIELGKNYLDKDWTQTLMPLSTFIDDYILKESEEIGYLAQTQLLDQIPELKEDIMIPDYCGLSLDDSSSDEVIIHSWFGPKGTISPIHYDKYHNLLSQVFGRKYLRIYDTDQTPFLYPHQDKLSFNSSQVDAERPDLQLFPLFEKASYKECILGTGEMLYIPPNYWHYVRSLETTFSLSFWWS